MQFMFLFEERSFACKFLEQRSYNNCWYCLWQQKISQRDEVLMIFIFGGQISSYSNTFNVSNAYELCCLVFMIEVDVSVMWCSVSDQCLFVNTECQCILWLLLLC
eukprot:TRINITY_DN1722_c0_g3_i1.p5 TRINITY_DN1722_c0_g3~~TRINITY_DN1722_c0_g3_i1.p5  ORF type:complete len:105 (-),score=0.73 TRINITY_DN1722_c0_g3_i1:51-365(-)